MKKLIIPGLVLAASVVFAPLASAADVTGPDTVGCATATVTVQQKAVAAAAVAQSIADQQSEVIKALKAKVVSTQAAYDSAYAAYQAAKTDTTLAALLTAQAALDTALKNLANEPSIPAAAKSQLAAANLEVAKAISDRATACAGPTPATTTAAPTTTPAPTSTLAPTSTPAKELTCGDYASMTPPLHNILRGDPRYRAALDSDGDGIGCELVEGTATAGNTPVVTAVPVGAVDTGWAR